MNVDPNLEATGPEEDLEAVSLLVTQSVSRFLRLPENANAVAQVLVGTHRGNDAPKIQNGVVALLADVADNGLDIVFTLAHVGDLSELPMSDAAIPIGVEAAIVYAADVAPVVLLSKELGFREMILVAHKAAIDVLIRRAIDDGIVTEDHRIAANLTTLIRQDELASNGAGGNGAEIIKLRPVISVMYQNKIIDASMV